MRRLLAARILRVGHGQGSYSSLDRHLMQTFARATRRSLPLAPMQVYMQSVYTYSFTHAVLSLQVHYARVLFSG
jgi:hypothetical protein